MYSRILLFFLLSTFANAQVAPPPPPMVDTVRAYYRSTRNADSLLMQNSTVNHPVEPKSFREGFQAKYRGADFDYTTKVSKDSYGQKIKRAILKVLEKILRIVNPNKSTAYAEPIFRIFLYAIAAFVLFYLIKFLLGTKGNLFFSKRNRNLAKIDEGFDENIHEIDFLPRISEFEKMGDYRSAIRYHFLAVLKKLSDKKLIIWNPEKTNKDYLNELAHTDIKAEYKNLVYIFDNVWYGEFSVDLEKYQQLKKKFSDFKI